MILLVVDHCACCSSNVGPESGLTIALFNELVSVVMDDVIMPTLNRQLQVGIPLPVVPGMSFVNSTVTTEDEYLLIGLDFTFVPPNTTLSETA